MTIRLPLSIGCLLLGAGLFSAGAGNTFDFANGKAIKRANGTWYTDFATIEESHEHADKVNIQIMEESSILMKNDNNTLPLKKGSGVSVLGNLSYHVVTGGTGSGGGGALRVDMVSGLEKSGFKVNGLAKDFYSTLTSTANISSGMFSGASGQQVQEDPSVLAPIEDSLRNYRTVVWTIGRTGGEGSDLQTNSLPTNKDQTKHYLELNDNELKMVQYLSDLKTAGKIDKVVVLLNTANVLEMGPLQNNAAIDAILWIGQPGPNGLEGVGHVLNGSVSPSGRTVDVWDADHKKDPTWSNFGDNSQNTWDGQKFDSDSDYATNHIVDKTGAVINNSAMVEYEEDIYLGYKYYETADAEAKAGNYAGFNYDEAVIYPFGYGLSYTKFSQKILTSSSEVEAAVKAATSLDSTFPVKVEVTNTGYVAGKEVVQLYNHAPYTKNGIAKAEVALVGFEKTDTLQPGESQVVTVNVRLEDLASFDYNDANKNQYKGWEIEAGDYELRLQKNSHELIEALKVKLEEKKLDNDDDATNNTVYSNGNDYDTLINMKAEGTQSHMKLMSRDDFTGTFPTPSKKEERYFGDHVTEILKNANYTTQAGSQTPEHRYTGDINGSDDLPTDPWYKTNADIPSTWTQATTREDGEKTAVQLQDMAGLDYWDTTTKVTEGAYKDQTAAQAWDSFMNQLTLDEMKSLLINGSYSTPGLASVGKDAAADQDGPAQLAGGYTFAASINIASTWNVDLAYERGRAVGNDSLFLNVPGWYAPSMNIHRSAFTGRNFEYYSQDAFMSGMIGAYDVKGFQDKGGYVYIKHYALNNCETDRTGIATFASEQTIRENYLKTFELSVKLGDAKAVMTSFNRIGIIPASANYMSSQAILRDEWGFHGQTVTDFYMGNMARGSMAIRAGNNMPLGRNNWGPIDGTWDATLRDGKGGVRSGNATDGVSPESPTAYYAIRKAAEQVLWVGSSTNVIENKYDKSQFQNQTVEGIQGMALNKSITFDASKYGTTNNSFSITGGTLPKGVSFNSATGTFTGTPTETGDFPLTVTLTSDKWVTTTAQITLRIKPLFTLVDVEGGKKIQLDDSIVISAPLAATAENAGKSAFTGVTYTVSNLPEGLTYDPETQIISGTTAETDYRYTVTADVTQQSVELFWGMFPIATTSHIISTSSVTVGHPAEPTRSVVSASVNGNGELILTYSDGTTQNVGVVKGEDGKDGETGIGVDGNNGTRIVKVEKTKTEGLVDTYTITMSDGSTFDFQVTNGADGAKGADGAAGEKGDKGDKGDKGETAAKEGGCSGSIIAVSSSIGAITLLGAGLILKKKKEEK